MRTFAHSAWPAFSDQARMMNSRHRLGISAKNSDPYETLGKACINDTDSS
jgi:hypothetical protein